MKIFLAAKLQLLLVLATIAPWLMWLDLNTMAIRFLVLKDRWPINKDMESISDDAIYRFLNPTIRDIAVLDIALLGLLISVPVWITLWFTIGRNLPVVVRYWLLGAVIIGWMLMIFDPTGAFSWYMD